MKRSISTIVLVSLAALMAEAPSQAQAPKPGVSARIPPASIDPFLKGVADMYESGPSKIPKPEDASKIPKPEDASKIPKPEDASKIPKPEFSTTIGRVDVDFKYIRILKRERPQITHQWQEPNKILVNVRLPKVVIESSYSAVQHTFVTDQHDKGVLELAASDVTLDLSVTIGALANGDPNISSFDCTVNLGQANANVRDAKEKFVMEALGTGTKFIRPFVSAKMCSEMKRLMEENLQALRNPVIGPK